MIPLFLRHRLGESALLNLKTAITAVLLSALFLNIAGVDQLSAYNPLVVETVHAATGIFAPINYQGRITAINGTAVADGKYNVRFKIYNAAIGGSPVWSETWNGANQVTMTGGLFSVALGSVTAMTGSVDFNTNNLYLQIEFDPLNAGTYTEVFAPRRQFGSVPYAHNADTLDGLDSTKFVRNDIPQTLSGTLTIKPNSSILALNIIGIASGSYIHANSGLSSSGNIVAEGSISGASLFIGTNIRGAGLVSDCNAASSALQWTASTGRFSCGSISVGSSFSTGNILTIGGQKYVSKQGDTMTGTLIINIQNGTLGSIGLKVLNTLSGAILHAEKALTSSGQLIVKQSGLVSLGSGALTVVNNTPTGSGAYLFANGPVLVLDSSAQNAASAHILFGYKGNFDTALWRSAARVLSVNGMLSGYTLYATDSIRSSGSIVAEGNISGASLFVGSSIRGAGLVTDCNSSTSALQWTAATGRFSCGTISGVSGVFSTGNVLTIGSQKYVSKQGDTMTGALNIRLSNPLNVGLNVAGTMSGRSLMITGTGSGLLPLLTTNLGASRVDLNGTLRVNRIEDGNNPTSFFLDPSDPTISLQAAGQIIGGDFRAGGGSLVNGAFNFGNNGGDTNTGLYSPGADTLAFITGGAAQLTILSTGNIGIGTTAPKTKLEVVGTISGSILYGNTSVNSSGSITAEGAISGASLFVGTSIKGAGLTNCITSTSALQWNSTTGRFSCGTISVGASSNFSTGNVLTIGSAKYVSKQGDTMTGALIITIQGGTVNSVGLKVLNTLSGAILHAEKLVTSSGSVAVESGVYVGGDLRFGIGKDHVISVQGTSGLTGNGLTIAAGDATTAPGKLLLEGGSGQSNRATISLLGSADLGGDVNIDAGDSGASSEQGGNVNITAGNGGNNPGYVLIAGGNNTTFSGPGGSMYLYGGRGAAGGNSGSIILGLTPAGGLAGNVGIRTLNPSTALEVNGTISGSTVYAANTLRSSGSITAEGAISGASLYIGTSIKGAGLVTDCNSASSALQWTAATGRFSCGTISAAAAPFSTGNVLTIGGQKYVSKQGDTMTGTLNINMQNGVRSTVGLNVVNTISGAVVYASKTLASSGSIIAEGNISGSSLNVGGISVLGGPAILQNGAFGNLSLRFAGASNTGFFRNGSSIEFDVGGFTAFSILAGSIQPNRGTAGTPGIAWSDSTNTGIFGPVSGAVGITITGIETARFTATGLNVVGTLSGATVNAKNSVNSSGSITAEGAISGASLYIGTSIKGAGLVTDCNTATSALQWTASTGRFSCGTISGGGGTFSTGNVLTIGSQKYVSKQGDTMTGALNIRLATTTSVGLNVAGTMSGRSLQVTGTGSKPLLYTDVKTGRIGINSTTPQNTLDILGSGSVSLRLARINTGTGMVMTRTNDDTFTLTNMISTPASATYSVDFNGETQYGTITNGYTNTIKGDDTYSVSLWFNSDTFGSPGGVLLEASGLPATSFWLEYNGSSGFYWASGGSYRTYTTATLSAGTWYNLTIVKTGAGNNGNLYLNGVLQNSYSGTLGSSVNSNSDFLVGKYHTTGYTMDGRMDDLRIYNTSLSATDVSNIYNNGNGSLIDQATGLAGWWKFDDGAGTSAADSSGNGLTMTLSGSPSWVAGKIASANVYQAATLIQSIDSLNAFEKGVVKFGDQQGNTSLQGQTLKFYTYAGSNIERARISSGGLLGLGTQAPGSTLSVSGSVLINKTGTTNATAKTGLALEVIGGMSGSFLSVSRNLNVTGAILSVGNIKTRGTLSGAALTVMSGNSYLLGNVGIGKSGTPNTKLEVAGTISGSVLYAANSLRSSGSIVAEGAISGASLYIGTSIKGAGLVTDCNSASSALQWTAATGRFSCGTISAGGSFSTGNVLTIGNSNYVKIKGSAMTGSLETPSINLSGVLLTSLNGFNEALNLNTAGLAINGITRLDGNGNLINIGTIQSNELTVVGGGTFANKVDYTTGGTQPWTTAIGDLNGDGKADLAVANNTTASVSVFLNTGTGSFAPKVDYTTGNTPKFVAMGDMNGDGRADLVVANQGSSSVSVFLNTGNGTFATKADYTTAAGPFGIALGDFNRDGKLDVATTSNTNGTVSVLMNLGNGKLGTKTDYTVGTAPRGLATADLNGDGKLDLVSANASSTSVSVLMNNGSGSFASKVDYTTGTTPVSVAIGDVNGDGKPDMAVANDIASGTVSVFINNGDGTFAGKVDYSVGSFPNAVAMGDITGDGKNDIVTANTSNSNASVLINKGNGTFATRVNYTTGASPDGVSIGDLNGDGIDDLVIANSGGTSISVLFNNTSTILYASTGTGGYVSIGTTQTKAKFTIMNTNAGFGSGAYIYSSGAVLLLEARTQSGSRTPDISFGYKGNFDTKITRTGTGSLTFESKSGTLLNLRSHTTSNTQNLFTIMSDATTSFGNAPGNLVYRTTAGGTSYADGSYNAAGADYAEWFRTSLSGASSGKLQSGDVVCIDITQSNTVKKCATEADSNVMGVVSTNPAFIGNSISGAEGLIPPGYALIGLIGQVPTKVMVTGTGAIRPGDSLTAASTPGFARKALPGESTLGVALEGIDHGTGTINVLISRRNSSVTVDAVGQKVLDTISNMKIGDEVQLMVASSLKNLNVDDQIQTAVQNQVTNLKASAADILSLQTEMDDLKNQLSALRTQTGSTTIITSSGTSVPSLPSDLQANTLSLENTLNVGSDAHISGDLHLDGTLMASSLFVPNGLTIDGGETVTGMMTATTIHTTSGAIIDGTLTVNGNIRVHSGALLFDSGSTVHLSDLIVDHSLMILGNITIQGMAEFFGNVIVHGELVLSSKQAGFALIPKSGTSVTVLFGSGGLSGTPVVTASPNSRVSGSWWIDAVTSSGFVINLDQRAAADVHFSWIAIVTEDPTTQTGTVIRDTSHIFPMGSDNIPVSSDMAFNACIRNYAMLDGSGKPISCSKYHDDYTWHQPDLLVDFLWNTNVTPPLLVVPDGYSTEVTENAENIRSAFTATNDTETPVVITDTGSTTPGDVQTNTGASVGTESGTVTSAEDPSATSDTSGTSSELSINPVTSDDGGTGSDVPAVDPSTEANP
jgi:hypothetical protein